MTERGQFIIDINASPSKTVDLQGGQLDRGSTPVRLPAFSHVSSGSVTGQAFDCRGSAVLERLHFSDSPKIREGFGRHVVAEQDGSVVEINYCTFESAGDEAVLVGNFPGRRVDITCIVRNARFDAGTRNFKACLLPGNPNEQEDSTAALTSDIKVILVNCHFLGSFRNGLFRGVRAYMHNCVVERDGYVAWQPPLVGGYPVDSDDYIRAGQLWHHGCYFDSPPKPERDSPGGIISTGTPEWAKVEYPDEFPALQSNVYVVDHAGHDAPNELRVNEPLRIDGNVTEQVLDWVQDANVVHVTTGTHRWAPGASGGLALRPNAVMVGDDGSCFDGERIQKLGVTMANDSTITNIEFKNFMPEAQHGVVEARTYTQTGPPNGWYEPISDVDKTRNVNIRKVYVHDSQGYGFVISDHTQLDSCRGESLGQGGYTSHGGKGGLIRGGQWRRLNLNQIHNPFDEAGNKIKHHERLRIEGGLYDDIDGTGIWFDIGNRECSVEGAIISNCTGPGVQFELSPYPCFADDLWIKRCGRAASPWLNQSAIQVYNAIAVVNGFKLTDNYNSLGAIQDSRQYLNPAGQLVDCRVAADFMNGEVLDGGQSGWVYDNGDASGGDRVTFANIKWRLGLSVTPGPFDEWRAVTPFRWGQTYPTWEEWASMWEGQVLVP